MEDFIVELEHIDRKCTFGQFLRDALRDRLVGGIRCEKSQTTFFMADDLTFKGACKIVLDKELVPKQTAALQARSCNESINAIKWQTVR